jgi:hypothetical protein
MELDMTSLSIVGIFDKSTKTATVTFSKMELTNSEPDLTQSQLGTYCIVPFQGALSGSVAVRGASEEGTIGRLAQCSI